MEASAPVAREKAPHVKAVPAPGTEDERHREHRFAEKKYPDGKNHAKGFIRMCPLESYPHDRHVGEADQPEIPAPPADSSQAGANFFCIHGHDRTSSACLFLELLKPVIGLALALAEVVANPTDVPMQAGENSLFQHPGPPRYS